MNHIYTIVLSISMLCLSLNLNATITSVTKSNNNPNVCTNNTVTVNGNLPGSNYFITSVVKSITGSTLSITVNIQSQGIGIPVITPYSTSKNFNDLDEGSYTLNVKEFTNGSLTGNVNQNYNVSGFNASATTTTNIGNTSATLNWSQISCSCNYLLRGRLAGTTTWLAEITISGSSNTSFNATGLSPGTSYEWRVWTECSNAGLAKTPLKSFTTTGCVVPNPASTTNVTSNSADLNWTATGGVGYEIWGRQVGGPIVKLTVNNPANTSYNATGLASSTTFEWAVRAICSTSPLSYTGFSAIQVFSTSTSASTKLYAEEVSVAPNPFSHSTTFTLPQSQSTTRIEIFNLAGTLLRTIESNDREIRFERGDLAAGIYVYRVVSGSEVRSGRITLL